ncbi:MAG TPA: PIN domain-containing protein [Streptomyces sp.]|uniref:PIN domain-containing protein n=1 Tax=Streptomyces sp. TaxID=1931 RepID=UPI002D4402B6|nr:PIN domain-containing protein [Streptomyces sp.]HZG02125.1 PIN domain-containing protein [Streptomyces sp.]
MISYLLDCGAPWHLFRTPGAVSRREEHIGAGAFRICEPTRTEFLHSATGPAHRDEPADELDTLCRRADVPKGAWRWVETARYKLTQKGLHRSAGPLDLPVCATAVRHDLTVLHVDNDFAAVADVLPELRQQDVRP